MHDGHKGEYGGDGQETKGREEKWQRDGGEDRERREGDTRGEQVERGETVDQDDHMMDAIKVNHTTSDVHVLIGK